MTNTYLSYQVSQLQSLLSYETVRKWNTSLYVRVTTAHGRVSSTRTGLVESRSGETTRFPRHVIAVEDRVERLVQPDAVARERAAQDALLDRADLSERAVAAPVQHGGARFEPLHAERAEREIEHELGALFEHATAPERRANREAPFRRMERRVEPAHLEDPDRRVEPS